ncbi:MAG: TIGR04283 family arsenosugar biosynthesis glycosyltransferase [Haliea sp.]|jgi:rSAM/selenodomain-associated transferase 2|nr:TIGR04283 family arsenosugar biosynthesis glycosyltransferase [Haliea sp.]
MTASPSSTLSFVIPVLNEAPRISQLLAMLAADFPDAERIVVDGGSADTTVACALPGATGLLLGKAGRAAQMNLGAGSACGDYLLFLHADTRPLFTAHALARALQGQPAWGFFEVRLDGKRWVFRVIERAMSLRSKVTGIGTGDQLLYVRRDVFEQAGGFAAIPLMEDIELCQRLRRLHQPRVPTAMTVETASRRWEQRGVIRTVVHMWTLRLGYALGISPQRLWHSYYGTRP